MTADGQDWRHWVVYQVYPRSFADSDGDGIGDLRGILAHVERVAGDLRRCAAGASKVVRSAQVHRTISQSCARTASSRSFSAWTTSPGYWPGRSRRPYLTRPSNSPTVRSSGQAKSV
jgi:hypothetical protein